MFLSLKCLSQSLCANIHQKRQYPFQNLSTDVITYNRYSGNFLYSSNSSSHSCSVLGGFIPFSKFHCVIDNPDSVSLQCKHSY